MEDLFMNVFCLSFNTLTFFFFWARGPQDLSSLTRDGTYIPCNGSVESQPLDCQGNPYCFNFLAIEIEFVNVKCVSLKCRIPLNDL